MLVQRLAVFVFAPPIQDLARSHHEAERNRRRTEQPDIETGDSGAKLEYPNLRFTGDVWGSIQQRMMKIVSKQVPGVRIGIDTRPSLTQIHVAAIGTVDNAYFA